jgi:hypothetical protein
MLGLVKNELTEQWREFKWSNLLKYPCIPGGSDKTKKDLLPLGQALNSGPSEYDGVPQWSTATSNECL